MCQAWTGCPFSDNNNDGDDKGHSDNIPAQKAGVESKELFMFSVSYQN